MHTLSIQIRLWALLIVLCFVGPHVAHAAKGFSLADVRATQANTNYEIYDFILPALISAVIFEAKDAPAERLEKAVAFVNFYSTPGDYESCPGLGTDIPWDRNASLKLRSGNIYCSEQSSLATLILGPLFPLQALRDVRAHTFHEVLFKDRWAIVDPMFDMRIKNGKGEPASFKDIQAYLAGNSTALRLPNKTLDRTQRYLDRFRKENYVKVRHKFEGHLKAPRVNWSQGVGLPVATAIEQLKANGQDVETQDSPAYLRYIRNNIVTALSFNKDPKAAAYLFQDYFFHRIAKDISAKVHTQPALDLIYFARNYQVLGRYDKAMKVYQALEQTPQIAFYKAQIHFMRKDKDALLSLREALQDNRFYKWMVWKLTGKHFAEGDHEILSRFDYRLYTDEVQD